MNTSLKMNVPVILSGILLAGSAFADGFRNPPEGAAALGKIGGHYAWMDDASAAAHNPANLADMTQTMVSASATFGYGVKEFTTLAGQTVESENPWSVLPNAFAVLPLEGGDWTAGIALTTPYGRSTEFPRDSALRYAAPWYTELRSVDIHPTLATRVHESLSIALGVHLLWSDLDIRQAYPWSVAAGVPGLPDGEATLEGDGVGIAGSLALTWTPAENHRVALVYRTPTQVDYEGDTRISNIPAPLAGLAVPRSDFDTEITFPSVVALAYGIALNDRLRVEANIEWIEHSQFDQLTLDAGRNTPLLPQSTLPADWDDNFTYGLGAEWDATDDLTLRAGYIYLETPIPSSTMLPTIAEEDQSVLSVGCSYARGNHTLDFAYAIGLFDGRDVRDNVNPAFNGDYDFESHLISLAYGYTF